MAVTTTTELTAVVNVVFQVNLLRNAKALCPYFTGTVPADLAENRGTFMRTSWRCEVRSALPPPGAGWSRRRRRGRTEGAAARPMEW